MTVITTARTAGLITALALSLAATSAFAKTTAPKMRHTASVTTGVKTHAKKLAPALETARGINSRASIDRRPDVPGYPPAQPAQ